MTNGAIAFEHYFKYYKILFRKTEKNIFQRQAQTFMDN